MWFSPKNTRGLKPMTTTEEVQTDMLGATVCWLVLPEELLADICHVLTAWGSQVVGRCSRWLWLGLGSQPGYCSLSGRSH